MFILIVENVEMDDNADVWRMKLIEWKVIVATYRPTQGKIYKKKQYTKAVKYFISANSIIPNLYKQYKPP